MKNLIVRMDEFRVNRSPHVLETRGIGSCIAIALYSPFCAIGGLAHVSLPFPRAFELPAHLFRFPKHAITAMLGQMADMGCRASDIGAYLIGGANLFECAASQMDIGRSILASTRKNLLEHKIPILGEAVRGDLGRSVRFDLSCGSIMVRRTGNKWKPLYIVGENILDKSPYC